MNDRSPGARAVSKLEIVDVFLVESQCHIDREFNPETRVSSIRFAHRLAPATEGLAQVRKDVDTDHERNVVRYFVDGGLRVLRPEVSDKDSQAIRPEDVLAEILVTLAVDYYCPKELFKDTTAIGAFSANAVFHAWPYWRSLIHSFSDQMRLPRITIPMMRQHSLIPFSADVAASSNQMHLQPPSRPKLANAKSTKRASGARAKK